MPIAQPRQRHRIVAAGGRTFAQNYTPTKHPVQDFKATVRMALRKVYDGAPPLEGPIFLRLLFLMPRPGRLIWKSRPMPRVPHIGRPDLDNLEKSVVDALTGQAWRDDSQVCEVSMRKDYAAGDEQPAVYVEIERCQ